MTNQSHHFMWGIITYAVTSMTGKAKSPFKLMHG